MGSSKWRLSRFRGRLIVPEDLEELFQKQIEPWPSQRFLYQIKREGLLLGTSDSPYSFRDSMVPSHSRTEGDVLFSEDISCIWAHMNSVLQQNWSLPAAQGGQGTSQKYGMSILDRKGKCSYCYEELHQDPTAIVQPRGNKFEWG